MTSGAAAAIPHEAPSRKPSPATPAVAAHGLDYDRAFKQLCHLVPLTEGKADEALDDVVLSALVLTDTPVAELAGVLEAVEAFFTLNLDRDRVQGAVDRLVQAGHVFRKGSKLSVCPAAKATKLEQIAAGHQLEDAVRAVWLACDDAQATGLDGDELWTCLRQYLASVLKSHGMLAVELLDPNVESSEGDTTVAEEALGASLKNLEPGQAAAARRAIEAFFAVRSAERVRYVAQMLDATFTLYAMTLDDIAASFLRADLPHLDIFLDTNVIFGVLELDTDVHGQAARELVRFIRENDLPITIYYHEQTLTETERTINGAGGSLRTRRWPSELSRAALDRRILGELRDIERRYHELNAETPMSAADFLSKYDHVQDLLVPHGIGLFRESGIARSDPEQKALLVAEYEAYVAELRPNDPKPYRAIDHDVSVWLAAQHRGQPASRPLEAGALFVTNDHFFRGFASKHGPTTTPVVVLPSQLLQVLRPFGRRSDDDDARFVAALCLPEFRTAHSGYAETQGKVLGFLAHYSDIDAGTAVTILANEVLMRRVRDMEPESPEFQTVLDDALMQDNASLRQQHDDVVVALERARKDAKAADRARQQELEANEQVLAVERLRVQSLEEQLDDVRRGADKANDVAEQASAALERQRQNLIESAQQRSKTILRLVVAVLVMALFTTGAISARSGGLFSAGAAGAAIGVLAVVGFMLTGWGGVDSVRSWLSGRLEQWLIGRYLARIGERPD